MINKRVKFFLGLIFIFFLTSISFVGTNVSDTAYSGARKYIEVCSRGIVYLPPNTEYVTCYGKVMRVIGIVRTLGGTDPAPDCWCPSCCGGICGIFVSCGDGGFCVVFLYCEG